MNLKQLPRHKRQAARAAQTERQADIAFAIGLLSVGFVSLLPMLFLFV